MNEPQPPERRKRRVPRVDRIAKALMRDLAAALREQVARNEAARASNAGAGGEA